MLGICHCILLKQYNITKRYLVFQNQYFVLRNEVWPLVSTTVTIKHEVEQANQVQHELYESSLSTSVRFKAKQHSLLSLISGYMDEHIFPR